MVDREKRRRIMARSQKLGHCICNPRQGCPCPEFRKRDICRCAGERPPAPAAGETRLTSLSDNAGCASKISQADLERLLAGLPEIADPRVLVGAAAGDDAGVYRLDEKAALVQSVDVFTPNVDDPFIFGGIAAANSLSDIYAMGGRPLTALSLIAYPVDRLPGEVANRVLRGGIEKMREAGVAVIGGHSLRDREFKFGFAVTGLVDPRHIISNGALCPGDRLILTKPLGVGAVSFAQQSGRAAPALLAAASGSMSALNAAAAALMAEAGASACTDVTGFGLLGHLVEMARRSGVTVTLAVDRLPVLDGVRQLLAAGFISGACEHNLEHAAPFLEVGPGVDRLVPWLLADPQTSGGLLIGIAAEKAAPLLASLHAAGVAAAAEIGRVSGRSSGRVALRSAAVAGEPAAGLPLPDAGAETAAPVSSPAGGENACCVGALEDGGAPAPAGSAARFAAFMSAAAGTAALGARGGALIALALALVTRCEPCLQRHLQKARALGISEAEIDAALWLAVSFGGAPVYMLYRAVTGRD